MRDTQYERVLFIGTGGGNDVFSTVLAEQCLRSIGYTWKSWDVAGVISPFHRHLVKATDIPGVFQTMFNSRRFMMRRTEKPEIGFIDSHVSAMLRNIRSVRQHKHPDTFALSLAHGSRGLQEIFERLHHRYDFFVLVDIGGDILYRGPEDTHVLSPFFDATVLRAFVDSGVPGILFEAGPGTDGELAPESIWKSLVQYEATANPIPTHVIDVWEELYERWIKDHRPGRTIPLTIAAYRSREPEIIAPYRARGHMGTQRYYSYFEQRISTEACRTFYLISPDRIKNPLAVRSANPMDWFLNTQIRGTHLNNEMNLEYLTHGGEELLQLLTPSPLLREDDRRRLIRQGIQELHDGICDAALALHCDENTVHQQPPGPLRIEGWQGMLRITRTT